MTGPNDNTRPISVAELLAKNGTLGAPVPGRRRRRRGNSDAVTVAELTGESGWPEDLAPWIRGDGLEYFCNGRVDYRVRGIHVRLEVRWDWQAEQGDDTHHALYRGTRCRLAVRQGSRRTVSAGAVRPAR